MIQHGKSGTCLKYRKDPDNTEQTGPYYCADGRVQGVAAATQSTCGNLIQAAYWLKKQDAKDTHGSAAYNSCLCCEQAGEKITEQDNGKNRNGAAYCG